MTTDTRLRRAAAYIDAVDLGDGQYAHYATETGRWYVVDEDDLASLCDYLDDPHTHTAVDAYSHWCAGTTSEEQPAWWTPETRTLEVVVGSVTTVYPDHGTDEDGEDTGTYDADLSAYVELDVTIGGQAYGVSVVVGARESDHGTVRASGAGVVPAICDAYWGDSSDWSQLPLGTEVAVLDAIYGERMRLLREAREWVAARDA